MNTKKELLTPTLTDEMVASAREMVGMPIRVEQYNYEASRDSIRHYTWGLGDDNPLYSDPAYAANTVWGGIIAPPTFLYAIFDTTVGPGLPDIQWVYSGTDWVFGEPIRRNDEIRAAARYTGVEEVAGKRVARMLVQTGEVVYTNQKGQRVGTAQAHTFRIPRAAAQGGLRLPPRPEHRYTPEELNAIIDAMLHEYRRGSQTLYWEDINVGDSLPGTVRGPLNQMDMTTYYGGSVGSTGYKSTKLRRIYADRARHAPELIPDNYDPSYYSASVSPSIGHQHATIATEEIGMPGVYDNGHQRIGMLATAVTNWMGDDGLMRKLSARLKQPVILGDTNYNGGQVSGKRLDEGRGLVECEIWGKNQLGQVTVQGSAVVELPRR